MSLLNKMAEGGWDEVTYLRKKTPSASESKSKKVNKEFSSTFLSDEGLFLLHRLLLRLKERVMQ